MKSAFWIVFVIVIAATGCWLWYTDKQSGGETANNITQLANPAAVYCIGQGGTLDMQETIAGTQGFCVFPDGTKCDEWAFFRGEECLDRQTAELPRIVTSSGTAIGENDLLRDPLNMLPF